MVPPGPWYRGHRHACIQAFRPVPSRRLAGRTIGTVTGIDDPYEIPEAPDLAVDPGTPIGDSTDLVPTALDDASA